MNGKEALPVLRRRREFLAVAQQGKKWVAPGLILQMGVASTNKAPPPMRYGLTASGKIGGAVVRNRARRRLRALANEILPFHAAEGRDYVLVARTTTVARAYTDLRLDLMTALAKLGALRGNAN